MDMIGNSSVQNILDLIKLFGDQSLKREFWIIGLTLLRYSWNKFWEVNILNVKNVKCEGEL